jgi:hypothetical protein
MRRLTLVLVPLALVVPGTACGGTASAQEIVSRAPEATVGAHTAAVTIHVELHGGGAGDLTFDGAGGTDFRTRRATITMDLGGLLKGVGAGGVDGRVTTLTDGTALYLRSALFDQALGAAAAGHWLKVDLAKVGATAGVDLSQLPQTGGSDPAQQLALLEGVSEGGVHEVGDRKVHGVDTTEYRARVDLAKAAKAAKGITDPKAFQRFVDQLGARTIDVSVWIDHDDHVRRVTVPVPVGQAAGGGTASMTVDFDHFGDPVDVAIPPADQVVDLQQLTGTPGD